MKDFVNASNWHTARDDFAVVPDARGSGSGKITQLIFCDLTGEQVSPVLVQPR